MENGVSTSAILLEIIQFSAVAGHGHVRNHFYLLYKIKKERRHRESLYMELTRENKAEAHSWQWYMAFLINYISKSYFPLEIHIKEEARWLEYFLLLVLSEEELVYVPYRDDSIIFLFIYPPIHSSTYSPIHEFMNLSLLFLYHSKSQGLK